MLSHHFASSLCSSLRPWRDLGLCRLLGRTHNPLIISDGAQGSTARWTDPFSLALLPSLSLRAPSLRPLRVYMSPGLRLFNQKDGDIRSLFHLICDDPSILLLLCSRPMIESMFQSDGVQLQCDTDLAQACLSVCLLTFHTIYTRFNIFQ